MSIIPEIDISALVAPNSSLSDQKRTLDQLHAAFKDVGFVSIVNHGVSQDLIMQTHQSALKFFHSSIENKMSIAAKQWNPENKNVYQGYFPSTVNGKEGLDITDPERKFMVDPGCHLYEMNKYPTEFSNEQLDIFKEYYTALHQLGIILTKAMLEIYNADTNMTDEMFVRPNNVATFRLNYYPQHEEDYGECEISAQDGVKLACETHADACLFTILHQDLTGGLQVQSPDTKEWYDVPCNLNAFVVNTGRSVQKLSNDRWKATYHRVKLGTKERLSIPFFIGPVGTFVIDSKIMFPNEERKYEPITYQTHMLETLATFKEYQRD